MAATLMDLALFITAGAASGTASGAIASMFVVRRTFGRRTQPVEVYHDAYDDVPGEAVDPQAWLVARKAKVLGDLVSKDRNDRFGRWS